MAIRSSFFMAYPWPTRIFSTARTVSAPAGRILGEAMSRPERQRCYAILTMPAPSILEHSTCPNSRQGYWTERSYWRLPESLERVPHSRRIFFRFGSCYLSKNCIRFPRIRYRRLSAYSSCCLWPRGPHANARASKWFWCDAIFMVTGYARHTHTHCTRQRTAASFLLMTR